MEQVVARKGHSLEVTGSSPVYATKVFSWFVLSAPGPHQSLRLTGSKHAEVFLRLIKMCTRRVCRVLLFQLKNIHVTMEEIIRTLIDDHRNIFVLRMGLSDIRSMMDIPSYNGSNQFTEESDLDYIRNKVRWYKSELERLQKELEQIKSSEKYC